MANQGNNNKWILRKPTIVQTPIKMRLFCFPPAGSGSWVFMEWSKHLPASVEVGYHQWITSDQTPAPPLIPLFTHPHPHHTPSLSPPSRSVQLNSRDGTLEWENNPTTQWTISSRMPSTPCPQSSPTPPSRTPSLATPWELGWPSKSPER